MAFSGFTVNQALVFMMKYKWNQGLWHWVDSPECSGVEHLQKANFTESKWQAKVLQFSVKSWSEKQKFFVAALKECFIYHSHRLILLENQTQNWIGRVTGLQHQLNSQSCQVSLVKVREQIGKEWDIGIWRGSLVWKWHSTITMSPWASLAVKSLSSCAWGYWISFEWKPWSNLTQDTSLARRCSLFSRSPTATPCCH